MEKELLLPAESMFGSKGLFIVPISTSEYVVQDARGNSSLPFIKANGESLRRDIKANFDIELLVPVSEAREFASKSAFSWAELEHWYVAHLDYALTRWLVGDDLEDFYKECYAIPIAYLSWGYGDGSRENFEFIDKFVREQISKNEVQFSNETLEKWIVLQQFKRIFSELLSLLQRAMDSFVDLLLHQRDCVVAAWNALEQLKTNEVIHRGRDSHRVSTAATMTAISLCSSLDIQSKLIHYLDQVEKTRLKFRPAGGKHFSDLEKFKPKRIPLDLKDEILGFANGSRAVRELIQFRHDVVHSTSAIELEKVYVGFGTPEINGMPLYYAYQAWRDCGTTGQPDRYLGRDYFTGSKVAIECRSLSWIHEVVRLHLTSAARIHAFLTGGSSSLTSLDPV
jgi:hypothetical protein